MRYEAFLVLLAVSTIFGKPTSSLLKIGTDEIETRIVGGINAEEGAVPYQFSLQHNNKHLCGGVIINDRWVATAAHCIIDEIQKVVVMTGSNKLSEPGPTYNVENAVEHCFYDIGLLRLKTSILFDEKTTKVALPTKPLAEGDELILTGWGRIVGFGESPDDLKILTSKFVPHDKCLEAWSNDERINLGHICSYTKEGEGACNGDSGGPVVHNGTLYGLVNWGEPCALGLPDMHANVYYLLDWIRRHVDGCNGW